MGLRNKEKRKNMNLKQTVKFKPLILEKEEVRKMNKFILLGHSSTDLNVFSDLMQKIGIERAISSQDKGLTASEITETILKAESLQALEATTQQLSISRVWDSLALDLFLANTNKRTWFWQDSKVLPLLDYWKNIDEKLGFILVYDDPRTILMDFSKTKKHLKPKHLNKLLLDWVEYNRTLLNFFYKNKDRVLLLNNRQVESNSISYIKELGIKIGMDIKKNNYLPVSEKALSKISDNPLNDLVVKSLLVEYPEVTEMYEELQSVANISAIENKTNDLNTKDAFCNLVNLQNKNKTFKSKLHKAFDENQKQDNLLEKNKVILENKVKSLEEAIKKEKVQKEENSLLLEQLHHVQEELEKYYLENKALKEKQEQVKHYYGAGERLKNEFTYTLGREMIKKVKSPLGLLSLPFFILTIRSKYKKDLKNNQETNLPPIETYADAYEAQRVKQHLTYMVGETSIKTMSNPLGLFVLPFKLKQTHNRFKKNRNG